MDIINIVIGLGFPVSIILLAVAGTLLRFYNGENERETIICAIIVGVIILFAFIRQYVA